MTTPSVDRRKSVHAIVVHWGDPTMTVELSARLSRSEKVDTVTVVANDLTARPAPLDPSVNWMVPPRNLGFAGGFDHAARLIGLEADFILSNSDLRIPEDCIAACLACLADESVGIAAPVTVNDEGFRAGVGSVSKVLCQEKMRHPTSPSPTDAEWVTGALMFIKGECYASAPFDLAYFLYWEDVDLCFRARRAGWRVVAHGGVEAWHRGGATIPTLGAYFYTVRNRLWFARRWTSRTRWVALSALMIMLIPRVMLADLVKRRGLHRAKAFSRGVQAGLRRPPVGTMVPQDEPLAQSWMQWR